MPCLVKTWRVLLRDVFIHSGLVATYFFPPSAPSLDVRRLLLCFGRQGFCCGSGHHERVDVRISAAKQAMRHLVFVSDAKGFAVVDNANQAHP